MQDIKLVRVHQETWLELRELGQFGETYNDIIQRLIDVKQNTKTK